MAAARAEPHGDAGWGLGGGGGDAALQCWAGRVLRVWGRQRGGMRWVAFVASTCLNQAGEL